MDTAAFITFGCKINQYETEAIREQVLALGYEEVDPSAPADLYVVNTCSVTAEGFAKSRRSILRAARANSAGRIVVVGCSTPEEKRTLEGIPQVAFVAGNEEKELVASFISGEWRPGEPRPPRPFGPWALRISRFSERTRASVKVQDGCNSFCSFCIIPFLRGRSRSRPVEDVVEEVRRLVEGGYREIVVSGVHIQHYGEDVADGTTLAGLLRSVADVPGLLRIRLSSLGVRALTPELMDLLENPLFCPHWHLPLQAGSDRTLERMRRDYRVDDFTAVVESLRTRFPDPSFSTDVVVGFPGEREEDFSETVRVARQVGFSKMHVFPYSRREGTLASKLGGDLPPAVIRRRARALRALAEELALAYKERFLGRRVDVLVEGKVRSAGKPEGLARWLEGFTERYVRVRFPEPRAGALERLRGTIATVRLRAAEPTVAWGEPLEASAEPTGARVGEGA